MDDLRATVVEQEITIAIVAVPSAHTQAVVDQLVDCGVRAILNYTPINAQAPPGVRVRSIDPVLALQSMTYYLACQDPSASAQVKAG